MWMGTASVPLHGKMLHGVNLSLDCINEDPGESSFGREPWEIKLSWGDEEGRLASEGKASEVAHCGQRGPPVESL